MDNQPNFIPWRWPLPAKRFDPACISPSFETAASSQKWRQTRVEVLKRGGNGNLMLADKLNACAESHRCGSGACPVCMRRFRRWVTGAAIVLFEEVGWLPGGGCAITAVPTWTARPLGGLATVELHKAENRIRKTLERSPLSNQPVIGGWDYSFNEHADGEWGGHWQPHLYLLFPHADDRDQVTRVMKDAIPKTDSCPRPIKCRNISDPMAAIGYAFKSSFKRRVSYYDKDGRADSRQMQLRPAQERELLTYLDQLGMTGRMFLRNVRRRGGRLVSCQRDRGADSEESC